MSKRKAAVLKPWLILLPLLTVACSGNDKTRPPLDDSAVVDPDGGRTDGPKKPSPDGGTTDLGAPPPLPPFINAHVDPACSATLYQVNAGTVATTCTNLWTTPDDVMQITVGEATDTPPTAGRIYTVKAQSQVSMYPADGEATAVYIKKSGSLPIVSGTFTINPYSPGATITGSYIVKTQDGTTVRGSFRADTCPVEPGSCE